MAPQPQRAVSYYDDLPEVDPATVESLTEFVWSLVEQALRSSAILRVATNAASQRFSQHLQEDCTFGALDKEVSVILHETLLEIHAKLTGNASAFHSEEYLALMDGPRREVDKTLALVRKGLGLFWKIPTTRSRAREMTRPLVAELQNRSIALPSREVSAVLHQVWLRMGVFLNGKGTGARA